MPKFIKVNSSPRKPIEMSLSRTQHSPAPLPFRSGMYRKNHFPPTRGRSRSPPRTPLRPVQEIKIYEEGGIEEELGNVTKGEIKAEEWAADKENLYDQIEKLTYRLDTANVLITSHKDRITDLEEDLKEKTTLVEEYKKLVRRDKTEKEVAHAKTKEAVERCERFKTEIVKLSHQVHYLRTAIAETTDTGQLQKRCIELQQQKHNAIDNLSKAMKRNGQSLHGWSGPEERVVKNKYLDD